MSSDEWHSTLLMISHHWFRWWLGAVRQQAITWTSIDQDLQRHMTSLDPNELNIEDNFLLIIQFLYHMYIYIYLYMYIHIINDVLNEWGGGGEGNEWNHWLSRRLGSPIKLFVNVITVNATMYFRCISTAITKEYFYWLEYVPDYFKEKYNVWLFLLFEIGGIWLCSST